MRPVNFLNRMVESKQMNMVYVNIFADFQLILFKISKEEEIDDLSLKSFMGCYSGMISYFGIFFVVKLLFEF